MNAKDPISPALVHIELEQLVMRPEETISDLRDNTRFLSNVFPENHEGIGALEDIVYRLIMITKKQELPLLDFHQLPGKKAYELRSTFETRQHIEDRLSNDTTDPCTDIQRR